MIILKISQFKKKTTIDNILSKTSISERLSSMTHNELFSLLSITIRNLPS